MSKKDSAHKRPFFSGLWSTSQKQESGATEKARLEAFLAAVPAAYCGWAADGSVAYSPSFCEILGLNSITSLEDVKACLSVSDSAALEGLYARLRENGIAFTLTAHDVREEKTFKISGVRGKDAMEEAQYHVLWLEDITQQSYAHNVFVEEQQLLHKELDRLQDSLDALPHPVWIRDEAQRIKWCNVAYAKRIDATPSDIVAQQKEIASSARKKKTGEKDSVIGPELACIALEKAIPQTTKMHVVMAGTRILMRFTEIPLKSRQITVGIAEDLSEAENLQTEIRSNLEAQKVLLEQLRSAIGIYDVEQRLSFYNSSFAQLWHLEDGWLNTKPKLGEIMEKLRETRRLPEQADFKRFKQSWLDMFTGLLEPREDMLYLPDGSALRMLVVPHKAGGLMMTFEDVTSRLSLESSYNTLVAVQRETLDNLDEGVVVFGGDGRLKLCNPSFGRMWGINPESLEGEPHITRIIDRMKPYFSDEDWSGSVKEKLMALGLDRTEQEGRFDRQDKVLIDYSTVPLPDGGVLLTYTDVTDSVRVENALREKNAALEAAEQLKLDFLANVSYQLRTPLNAIMGFNEMLEQQYFGPLNDKQREYTRDIHEASGRLLGLINDILDLATIEAGYMDLEFAPTSVKGLLESVTDLITDWARKGGIELKLKCPADIGVAELDGTRIKQALMNLLRNAMTHTPKGGKIEVIANKQNKNLEIVISDTGIGIALEDQLRVLQPFERIESQKSMDHRGVGLGLTLVQNIVGLHGGVFELESAVGKGTRVTIKVPVKQSDRVKNKAA